MSLTIFRKICLPITAFLSLSLASSVWSAEGTVVPPKQNWKHQSLIGTFDRAAAQRGFQVYQEVCSACHSMDLLSYRNLEAIGYSPDEADAFASEFMLMDGPDDEGEMFERKAIAADGFVSPYVNDNAARASNNGALPPDLSLMEKARAHGEDYIYAVLTGYAEAPDDTTLADGMSWNKYFPGHQIAMPQMLSDDGIEYQDGTTATIEQQAYDVAVFLTWAADPHREARLAMGLKAMIFLSIFAFLMYLVKRKVWSDIK